MVTYREKALEMKGRYCHICGSPGSSDEVEIEVHHIDGDHSNNHIYNLLPVCRGCHHEIHTEAPHDEHIRIWATAAVSDGAMKIDPRIGYGFEDERIWFDTALEYRAYKRGIERGLKEAGALEEGGEVTLNLKQLPRDL